MARFARAHPGFAAVAVLCLAVGIGVNTAAFSFLDAIMFREYPGIERRSEVFTVRTGTVDAGVRSSPTYASYPDFQAYRGVAAFAGLAAAGRFEVVTVAREREPLVVVGQAVSGNLFTVLGTRAARGRLLAPSDDAPGAPPALVVSHDFFAQELGSRADAIGELLRVGAHSFTVVGVAPRGFFGTQDTDPFEPRRGSLSVYVPLAHAPLVKRASPDGDALASMNDRWIRLYGRLAPGVGDSVAAAQVQHAAQGLAVRYPAQRRGAYAVVRNAFGSPRGEAVAAVVLVMAVPVILLLVACANLANQLLARAVQRRREIAVRLSLGATRGRLVRHLLGESMLLAVLGGALGLLLSLWLLDAVEAFVAMPFPVTLDARSAVFTLALAFVTAVAFGLIPALSATRVGVAETLKSGGSGSGSHKSRLRGALVVVQVAASLALLTLAGVFARGAEHARGVDMGLESERLLAAKLDLGLRDYARERGIAFQREAMARVAALPGIEAVGLAPFAPLDQFSDVSVRPEGGAARWMEVAEVSGGWMAASGARITRGRGFSEAELTGIPAVAVVDEAAVRKLWPAGGNPIGQSLRVGPDSAATVVTVVGVLGQVRGLWEQAAQGMVLLPDGAAYNAEAYLWVRTIEDPAALTGAVRAELRALDPLLPLTSVRTVGELYRQGLTPARLLATGFGVVGAAALALAVLGLYAVLSFVVAQRSHELGVRMALGAASGAVVAMVLRQAGGLTLIGVVIGAALAAAAATLMRSLLFGLPPVDPLAFLGSAAALIGVAAIASAIPARRATKVDPMVALRAE